MTRQRAGSICLTKLVIGVFGLLLFATLHQRTIRQWQRFLQNSLQSAEFQAAVEPALSSFNLYFIAIGILMVALTQISAPCRMYRQARFQP
jgi:hypothetical protein